MSKTVYIIGAGASKEVGLPVGSELKDIISGLLNFDFDWQKQTKGDRDIFQSLADYERNNQKFNGNMNFYTEEAHHIRDSLPLAISIDNFIHSHKDNETIELCGKLAIVKSILQAERKSKLFISKDNQNLNFKNLLGTWYISFFQSITEGCTKEDLPDRFKKISLIIFNYDRCVEHFLFYALKHYYKLNDYEARDIILNLTICHPYGDVGGFSWRDDIGCLPFGYEADYRQLLEMSKRIKTFTEGVNEESKEFQTIQEVMSTSTRLVFLGFAFHKLNMKLLKPIDNKSLKRRMTCYGSTLGISSDDKDVIGRDIQNMFPYCNMARHLFPENCANLFQRYWRGFAY